MNKPLIIIASIFILSLGVYWYTTRDNTQATLSPTDTDTVSTTTTASLDSIMTSLSQLKNAPNVQTAELDPIADTSTGTAYIVRNSVLEHAVTAVLPNLDSGTYYEGWLVKPGTPVQFISTGTMSQDTNGVFYLYFTSENLYEGYDDVVITLETKLDEIPEEHVLEGAF